MSCPEFESAGYLFLSGELTESGRRAFEKHLKKCPACQEELASMKEIWGFMEKLPQMNPSPGIRESILRDARRKKVGPSLLARFRSWTDGWARHRGLVWGLSTAVVALFIMIIFIRPFDRMQPGQKTMEEILAWNDDFKSEVDWMDQEIDRVESGSLLTNYVFSNDEVTESDDWLSPMSEDINWIRDKVEDLVKTIYGI